MRDIRLVSLLFAITLVALAGCGGDGRSGGTGGTRTAGMGGSGGEGIGPLKVTVDANLIRLVPEVGGDIAIEVVRGPNIEGAITIEAQGLPPGVGATPIQLDATESDGAIPIAALPTAAQGGPTPIRIVATLDDDTPVTDDVLVDLYVAGPRGSLDRSFANDGVYLATDVGVVHAGLDEDGSLVLAGQTFPAPSKAWISRLTVDGAVDGSFGTDGVVTDFVGGTSSGPRALYMRENGGFLFVGSFFDAVPIPFARAFLADGSVDTSYGTGGDVVLSSAFIRFVAKRKDGFVIATTSDVFAFDKDGEPVADYGPPSFPGNPQFGTDDGTDRIMMAGSYTDEDDSGLELTRLTADGALDTGFGFMSSARGVATMDPDDDAFVKGLTIARSGRGVAFGSVGRSTAAKRVVYLSFRVDVFVNSQVSTLLAVGSIDQVAASADDIFYYSARDGQDGDRHVIRAKPHNSSFADSSFGADGEIRLPSMTAVAMLIDERLGRLYIVGRTPFENDIRVLRLWL